MKTNKLTFIPLEDVKTILRGALDTGPGFEVGTSVTDPKLRAQLMDPEDIASAGQIAQVEGLCRNPSLAPDLCALKEVISGKGRVAEAAVECLMVPLPVTEKGIEDIDVERAVEQAESLKKGLFGRQYKELLGSNRLQAVVHLNARATEIRKDCSRLWKTEPALPASSSPFELKSK